MTMITIFAPNIVRHSRRKRAQGLRKGINRRLGLRLGRDNSDRRLGRIWGRI